MSKVLFCRVPSIFQKDNSQVGSINYPGIEIFFLAVPDKMSNSVVTLPFCLFIRHYVSDLNFRMLKSVFILNLSCKKVPAVLQNC